MSSLYFQPDSHAEALAQELAERLHDPDGLPFYLAISERLPESVIRSVLRIVMEVPDDRIRVSRGALFNWLLHHYGEQQALPLKRKEEGDDVESSAS